jgi:hypothetical protein
MLPLALVGIAAALELTTVNLNQWNKIMQLGESVTDTLCAREITKALNEANESYQRNGLEKVFLRELENVLSVAGDVDEADEFRNSLRKMTFVFQGQLANDSAKAQFIAKEKELETEIVVPEPGKDEELVALGIENQEPAYGVMNSGCINSISGLIGVAALLTF